MNQHFPALIVIAPLLTALFVTAVGWIRPKFCFPLTVLGLFISLLSSVGLFLQVLQQDIVQYKLGGWEPPFGIEYRVDLLNALILVVISVVAWINLVAAQKKVSDEFPDKIGAFYGLYSLFVAGLAGIVVTGDAFNLYVLLEVASLTGYALIGMGKGHAPLAGLNYVIIGTIGASFYLLGIGYLYLVTGSLNMADLGQLLPPIYQSKVVVFAFLFCLVGLFIKMAFFPLHAWLPNAYSYSPNAASGLIAPLTTKVMIYVMIRLSLTVFTPSFSFANALLQTSLVWLAVIAIVVGSIMALSQRSITRMLTYIIVAEVGYMVGGFWLGNQAGITGAILHIVNDAAMTLCLFLAAGNIIYKMKADKFSDLKGLIGKMPFTFAAFIIGALSIIGVPPTCGFFSKWYLISGGLASENYGFVAALIFSSLVNVVLFFRIIEIGFFEKPESTGEPNSTDDHTATWDEAPVGMVIPLTISALILIGLGVHTGKIVELIQQFTFGLV